ncbi:ATP-binding cassette domain-containing protein [Streptomyces sp. DSM 44917]|uniref:ATP-binding cassette domain-containing protein n=1 Tax=Streptomyces boetiae TaxID=3075541 RepID=A0ABU2L557_9ACTN|nr:ATP-binding cassette domain-containing protein [Streptomyces sp. DSM 44917]MDT0306551.1 ATP-binding cassette domain-containing protein [Streptomyces sp. DSM 44917]
MSNARITCARLSFSWPDGTPVFEDLDLAFGPGRTGLTGLNGSGKSTLLRLIAGRLTPASGAIRTSGEVGYLPQSLTLDTGQPVDRVLGIDRVRAALHAIEGGDPDEAHFETVGDDWDVEERTRATLDQLGLGGIDLDRTVGQVSGGETVLLRLAALLLCRPEVLLLDEPTNNLDLRARRRLCQAVDAWPGVMVVVSHDRELLERVDRIAELRGQGPGQRRGVGAVRVFGGPLSAYEETLAVEQEAAERTLRAAEADVKRQKRDLTEAHVKLAARARNGRKAAETKGLPRIVAGALQRSAQVSAGKHRQLHEDRLAGARERLARAEEAVRDDDEIRVDLPHTAVPPRRAVFTLREVVLRSGARADLAVHGPERIALTGRNGAGKTTLLRALTGELPPAQGEAAVHVPLRHLPQRLDVLDPEVSLLENVRRLAPGAREQEIRDRLARFLFRKARPDQRVGDLSGGERFRATLAALMLAEPAPQLLLLDEPTNNLDLASVGRLTSALASYQGALLIASHDVPFLRTVGITRWLSLDGELTETEPL